MHDPFPFSAPSFLVRAIQPFAESYSLPTLPLHIHEILFAAVVYQLINLVVSPWLSSRLFPRTYPFFNQRTRINWDVHVVSLFQSVLICGLALWVMWSDDNPERAAMSEGPEAWQERIWGYTGAEGLIQAFACGYFLWDLWISTRYLHIFGPALLAHAVSALLAYSFGYRPFVNYYAPNFILYELSSPFLNIHWFCDKLSLTGSAIQLYNGIVLMTTFFGCRLIWGTYQSFRVFSDIYKAVQFTPSLFPNEKLGADLGVLDRMRFVAKPGQQHVPLWLAGVYLSANITLTALNFVWFGKMVETIRSRFAPPFGTKVADKDGEKKVRRLSEPVLVEGIDVDTDEEGVTTETEILRSVDDQGHKTVEVERTEVRKRKP